MSENSCNIVPLRKSEHLKRCHARDVTRAATLLLALAGSNPAAALARAASLSASSRAPKFADDVLNEVRRLSGQTQALKSDSQL